jgi:hypothetical protein
VRISPVGSSRGVEVGGPGTLAVADRSVGGRGSPRLSERRQLIAHQRDRKLEPPSVRDVVEPAARTGGMRKRYDRCLSLHEGPADCPRQARQAEQASQREPADRDDERRSQQRQLPLAPELAEPLLGRRRRAVAATRGGAARIAPRHRSAVERRVERGFVQLEPTSQRPARAAPPRPSLDPLDRAWRLAEEVRALSRYTLEHRLGIERESRLEAGAAAAVVALKGCKASIGATARRHAADARRRS